MGDFSSIKAGNLDKYMPQLQSTLFDKLGPGKPREMGTYLLKDFGEVSSKIDTIGCITTEIAQRFFQKWKEDKYKEATYGVLKETLRKVKRNDLVKNLNDPKLGIDDNAVVEDVIVLKHVIKKIAPDDLSSMAIHLINDYPAIQKLIKTAGPGPPNHSGQAQAIVYHWITDFPEETADTLMYAVEQLDNKKLLINLGELLAEIKEKLPVAAKAATDETDAPTKSVAPTFPVAPETNPGQHGADLASLKKELDQLAQAQPSK